MQLTNAQQYLVKTNKNLVYHFFLDTDKSLHYSIYSSNETVIESEQLVASVIEFSVTIDNREKIHLICITKEGELIYYINQNDKWSNRTISKLDFRSNIYRHLTLYVIGNYIHIIYNKSNLLTPMLSSIDHIYWNQKGINKAIVANYIHGRYPSPLQVAVDSFNNLHLVYKVYYKNSHQLYYSRFNLAIKKWNAGELITNLQEDHSHPYIFVDNKDNLHLAWCTIEQNNFVLKYKKKINVTNSKSKWWSVQSLSNKNSNTLSPILIQVGNNLKIYCKQNNQIVEFISKDFGHSWEASYDNVYKIEDPKIIRYSNSQESKENIFINNLYGNINNKIEVAGIMLLNIDEDEATTKNSLEETKSDIDTDTMTKNNINEPNHISEENPIQNPLQKRTYSKDFYAINQGTPSTKTLSQLLDDYEILKTKINEIENEKQRLSKTVAECESSLILIEEKIVDYKKQMLTLEDNLNEISTDTSLFQRFINLFK